MKIVVDAYAWIEIFIGSEEGKRAKENIEQASEAYTPDTVLAEVARKYLREGMKQETIDENLSRILNCHETALYSFFRFFRN